MNCNCVVVAGYYYTGSSAVVDLLKEYRGAFEPNVEFRLIKDPYGLNDLRYNLVEHWDPLNADNAIKDFLWLAFHLNYPYSKLSLVKGLGYSNRDAFGDRFMKETNVFIDNITDFTYDSSWWFTEFKQSKTKRLKEKIIRFFRSQPKNTMYFSCCTAEEFDRYATEYLERLFSIDDNNNSFAIIDQGLAAQNPENINHFFRNARMIIVDRDPRDVYVETRYAGLIGKKINQTRDAQYFIKWFKKYRERTSNEDANILRINFEDLILRNDETVELIESFLGIDPSNHIEKGKYLKPEVSKTNIGKWNNQLNHDEIKKLDCLKDYYWI